MTKAFWNLTKNVNSKSFRNYLDAEMNCFSIQSADLEVLHASKTLLSKLGYDDVTQLPPVKEIYLGITSEELTADRKILLNLPLGEQYHPQKLRYARSKNGKIVVFRLSHVWFKLDAEYEKMLLTNFSDVTIEVNENNFNSMLLKHNPAILLTQDRHWKIVSTSQAWTEKFGHSSEQTIGRDFLDFIRPEMVEENMNFRAKHIKFEKGFKADKNLIEIVHKDGSIHHVEIRSLIEEVNGELINLISLIDVTDLVSKSIQLNVALRTDSLTGLLNRRALQEWLVADPLQGKYCLFMVDIDNFKSVNDAYGHDVGDALLRQHGQSIKDLSGSDALVFRMGGEEFLIIKPIMDWNSIAAYGNDLRKKISKLEIAHDGVTLKRTISIGVAESKLKESFESILKRADEALNFAKANGKDRIICADTSFILTQKINGEFIGPEDLLKGLRRKELNFHLQPIYKVDDMTILGFEALIRWQKDDGQLIAPKQFTESWNLLFSDGNNLDLLHELLEQVVNDTKHLNEHFISINFPAFHFSSEGSADRFIKELAPIIESKKHRLVVELIFNQTNGRSALKATEVEKLKEAGVSVGYDGLGLDGSILEVFKYPFDMVKINLANAIRDDDNIKKITKSLLSGLKEKNVLVIAKGIETQIELESYSQMGVNVQQGFHLCKPLNRKDVRNINRKNSES